MTCLRIEDREFRAFEGKGFSLFSFRWWVSGVFFLEVFGLFS